MLLSINYICCAMYRHVSHSQFCFCDSPSQSPKSQFPSAKIGKSQFPFYPLRALYTQFQIRVHIPYPLSDQNGQNLYPVPDQNSSKTIPFGAAHTSYMAYIRECPPPRGPYIPPISLGIPLPRMAAGRCANLVTHKFFRIRVVQKLFDMRFPCTRSTNSVISSYQQNGFQNTSFYTIILCSAINIGYLFHSRPFGQ